MKDAYTEEFLRRLQANLDLKKQREVFEAILGKVIWEILPQGADKKDLSASAELASCDFIKQSCPNVIFEAIESAKEHGRIEKFCCGFKNGLCMPLKQGNQLYGFIVACGFQKEITDDLMNIFYAFTQTVMREVQKEMELTKLYDTIRPRAIALSTIHTVHRLISSTLDLDELMPRIARLCLQVMRAHSCSIYMLEGNRLFLKTSIKFDKVVKPKTACVKLTGALARVIKTGASILKPSAILVPLIDEDSIGLICVSNKLGEGPFTEFDKEILTTFAEQAVIAVRNAQLYQEQEKVTVGSIKSLAAILDMQAPRINTHSMAFAELVVETAKEMGVSPNQLRILRYASLLHDAGKIMIPDEILKKPRKLTGEEYKIVKEHPLKGAQIVKPIEVLKPIVPIILYHHERYDGTGYPKRLKGEDIPLGSRIMAVVDAFVAMLSKQPYRERLTVEEAISEIRRYSGTQFDPKVTEPFLRVISRINVLSLLRKKSKES